MPFVLTVQMLPYTRVRTKCSLPFFNCSLMSVEINRDPCCCWSRSQYQEKVDRALFCSEKHCMFANDDVRGKKRSGAKARFSKARDPCFFLLALEWKVRDPPLPLRLSDGQSGPCSRCCQWLASC